MLDIESIIKPDTLTEALEQLAAEEWIVLMGGTDIIPAIRDGRIKGARMMDIALLKGDLGSIYADNKYLYIGALATHEEIANNADVLRLLPALATGCRQIGSRQIRNRASIGGNIVNASPAADSLPALVAAGASVVLKNSREERIVDLEQFAIGPSHTVIAKDELLTEIRVPIDGGAWQGKYIKVGSRNALIIAVASAAILQNGNGEYRIACGSVNPTVRRAPSIEAIFNSDTIQDKAAMCDAVYADINPIDDVRASRTYRAEVLVNLLYNEYIQKKGVQ
jgi:CO/xanthine dehydrogenase FAD-binding subunit